jgi:hypothetical protein
MLSSPRICGCFICLMLTVLVGCRAQPPDPGADAVSRAIASGLNPPRANRDVQAWVVPPLDWKPDALKTGPRHTHQVWISPSGGTAYGVIYINLPLPVGSELTLWGFLQEMQRIEGRADLLSKENDEKLPGLRFVAQGGLYTVRTNLIVSGFNAWAVYAGTLNDRPVNPGELDLARCAREQTRVGLAIGGRRATSQKQ